MAISPQQARMKALQLRTLKPELRNMAVEDLTAQVMASEGMGAPGAGGGGLADLFPPKTLTAASPAPMMAARFQAAKPTAQIVPGAGADSFRAAQEIRQRTERGPTPEERSAANARVQSLIADLPASMAASAPDAAAPARTASPVTAALAAAQAPAKVTPSLYRPMLEQAQAELEQLDAQQQAITAQGDVAPPELVSKFENLSGKVSQLKGMVAAEEGAVVNAERASVIERQTQRLSREKELVEEARKRAPFDALIAGGAALASARPGESFTSALTRGLQAGNQSYSGARDAREAGLLGIEEKRDALILQNADAIDKARADAIALAKTGVELDAQKLALTKLKREDVKSLATQQADIDLATANASKAKTDAKYAPEVYEAEIDRTRAQAEDARRPPASGGSGSGGTGGKPLSPTQAFNRANAARVRLEKLEKRIIESDGKGDVATTEQLLNQYKSDRDAYNQNATGAGLAPITVRGFPVKLRKYEDYVKKNKRHPSGRTYATGSTGSTGTIVSSKPLK